MNVIKKDLFLLVCLLLLADCARYVTITPVQLEQRTVKDQNQNELVATYYPATYKSARPKEPVILFDSLLVHKSYLHQGEAGGFIAWLNSRGYGVWLIHYQQYQEIDLEQSGRALAGILASIKKKSGQNAFHLGGLSMGGRVWVHYFNGLQTAPSFKVKSLFFIATPFDYMAQGSYYEAQTANPSADCKTQLAARVCQFYTSEQAAVKPQAMLNYRRPPKQKVSFSEAGRQNLGQTPVVLLTGKIDSIAGEESLYPEFIKLSAALPTPPLFFVAGRSNGFDYDYDHFSLWYSEYAAGVYQYLDRFLMGDL